MNFLKAKDVKLVKCYPDRNDVTPLYTESDMEQNLYLDMEREDDILKTEICIMFGKNHPAPKRLSISAIQYTMNPMELEISLFERGQRKAYDTQVMGEFRTFVVLKPDTTRVVITSNRAKCKGKATKVKLSVNYVEF